MHNLQTGSPAVLGQSGPVTLRPGLAAQRAFEDFHLYFNYFIMSFNCKFLNNGFPHT